MNTICICSGNTGYTAVEHRPHCPLYSMSGNTLLSTGIQTGPAEKADVQALAWQVNRLEGQVEELRELLPRRPGATPEALSPPRRQASVARRRQQVELTDECPECGGTGQVPLSCTNCNAQLTAADLRANPEAMACRSCVSKDEEDARCASSCP